MNLSFRAAVLAALLLVGCRNPVFDWTNRPVNDDDSFAEWTDHMPRDDRGRRDEDRAARRPSAAGSKERIARLLEEAQAAVARNDREAATALLRQVLQIDDRQPDAHHRLAILADQQGDYRLAEEHYRTALAARPRDPDLLSDIGYSYYLQGRQEESERYLKKALDVAPGHARAANNLNLLHARRGAPNGRPESHSEIRNNGRGSLAASPALSPNATTDDLMAAMRAERMRAEAVRSQRESNPDSHRDRSIADSRSQSAPTEWDSPPRDFGAPPPKRHYAAANNHALHEPPQWADQRQVPYGTSPAIQSAPATGNASTVDSRLHHENDRGVRLAGFDDRYDTGPANAVRYAAYAPGDGPAPRTDGYGAYSDAQRAYREDPSMPLITPGRSNRPAAEYSHFAPARADYDNAAPDPGAARPRAIATGSTDSGDGDSRFAVPRSGEGFSANWPGENTQERACDAAQDPFDSQHVPVVPARPAPPELWPPEPSDDPSPAEYRHPAASDGGQPEDLRYYRSSPPAVDARPPVESANHRTIQQPPLWPGHLPQSTGATYDSRY